MREVFICLSLLLILALAKVDPAVMKAKEQFSVKRMACFMASRYYYNNQREAIESIVTELTSEQLEQFERKKFPEAMEHCMELIDFDGAKKVFD